MKLIISLKLLMTRYLYLHMKLMHELIAFNDSGIG